MLDRRLMLRVLLAAVGADVLLGLWFGAVDHVGPASGLYFAVTTATTVGYGDITPHGWAAHLIAVLIMVTVIPLFGTVFSLFTSALTATHVHAAKDEMKRHVEHLLRHRQDPGAG